MTYNIILQLSPQFLLRMLFSTCSKTAGPFVQKVDNYMNYQKLCYTAYAEQPFAFSFFFLVFSHLTSGVFDKILMVMMKKLSCPLLRNLTEDQNNLR